MINLDQYIPVSELITLIVGAFLGWFPNRKRQKVDAKQIEVDVLEKSLQVIHKDVVEPLNYRFLLIQDDYTEVLKELKRLRYALSKMYTCRYVSSCPIGNELQQQKADARSKGRKQHDANRQRAPNCSSNDDSNGDTQTDSSSDLIRR